MDRTATPEALRFAGFVLDGARRCLRGPDGAEVAVAPKPFDLLVALARNAGRTMGKDALLDAVWPGVHVTEDSLFQADVELNPEQVTDLQGRLAGLAKQARFAPVAPVIPVAPAPAAAPP